MSERDDQMLLDHVIRLRASLEAECKARDLLRCGEGNTLAEVAEAAAMGGEDVNPADIAEARETLELPAIGDDDDVAEGLDDLESMFSDALEIRAEGYRNGYDNDSWVVERVRVCVGLGGPNLFIFCDGSDAWIDGYWGGSKVEGKYLDSATAGEVNAAVSYFFE